MYSPLLYAAQEPCHTDPTRQRLSRSYRSYTVDQGSIFPHRSTIWTGDMIHLMRAIRSEPWKLSCRHLRSNLAQIMCKKKQGQKGGQKTVVRKRIMPGLLVLRSVYCVYTSMCNTTYCTSMWKKQLHMLHRTQLRETTCALAPLNKQVCRINAP